MTVRALIQAGGSGKRMRGYHRDVPKPLVPVRGVPLLERALAAVIAAGFLDVTVSVPAGEPRIAAFLLERGQVLASELGATLHLLHEESPLGTIGAAGRFASSTSTLLTFNSDVLTGLDLEGLLGCHLETQAALTLATHYELNRFPFGEVRVDAGRVVAYREKPVQEILTCSGVAVLGEIALRAIAPGTRSDLPMLVETLLSAAHPVTAYHHTSLWIDVNDEESVARAEALIAANPQAFESSSRPSEPVDRGR